VCLVGSGLEPVADAGFGEEVPGVAGVGFEFAAELGDVDTQVVGFPPPCTDHPPALRSR